MNNLEMIFDNLIMRYPVLEPVRESIWQAYEMLEACYENDRKLLLAGNGGSCADAEHIVGELMKGFAKKRPLPEEMKQAIIAADAGHGRQLADSLQGALAAFTLTGHPSLSTAFLNDIDGGMTYAQQVYGYGRKDDVFLAISTSGNSKNIDYAVTVAKAKNIKIIGLTGMDGGLLAQRADVAIVVPEHETYKIQELHLPIYHALCLMLEERFFEE